MNATLTIRNTMVRILNNYTLEQLNTIPQGFNNNVFWNIAHVISIQQMLVIGLAGQRWQVDKEIVKEFKKDTKPKRTYDQADIDLISKLLIESIGGIQKGFEANEFANYKEYKTLTGFVIKDFDSACAFNLFHEGLHVGHIQSMLKFIK